MSPADLTPVSSIGAARAIARDVPPPPEGKPPIAGAKPQRPPVSAVEVSTGQTIDAGQPPIDADRVALIRAAIAKGDYPILPTKIADAIIAAPLLLGTAA